MAVGKAQRNADGREPTDGNGKTPRNTNASTTDCGCACEYCLCGGGTLTVATTSDITICTGCIATGAGHVNFSTATLAAGQSWCLTRSASDRCLWEVDVTPGPVSGLHYVSLGGCIGASTAVQKMRITATRFATTAVIDIAVYLTGQPHIVFRGNSPNPAADVCFNDAYSNSFLTCSVISIPNRWGHGGAISVVEGCEDEGI